MLNRIIELLPTESVDDDNIIKTLFCVEVEMLRTGGGTLKSAEKSCAYNRCETKHDFLNISPNIDPALNSSPLHLTTLSRYMVTLVIADLG